MQLCTASVFRPLFHFLCETFCSHYVERMMNLLDVLLLSGGGEDEEGEDNGGGGGGAGGALHGDRLGELKGALDRRLALNTEQRTARECNV